MVLWMEMGSNFDLKCHRMEIVTAEEKLALGFCLCSGPH